MTLDPSVPNRETVIVQLWDASNRRLINHNVRFSPPRFCKRCQLEVMVPAAVFRRV